MWPCLFVPPLLCVLSFPLELLYYASTCPCWRKPPPEFPRTPDQLSTPDSPPPAEATLVVVPPALVGLDSIVHTPAEAANAA